MCNITSIRLGVIIMSVLKVIFAVYVLGVGFFFSTSEQLTQAYGIKFIDFGGALIFMGIISGIAVIPHWYANKRHNRFLLLVVFVMDLIVLSTVAGVAVQAGTFMTPEFPKDLQVDCLLTYPTKYSVEECKTFLQAPRTVGFRLFWEGYYSNRKDIMAFQVLSTIQTDVCCGFYAPLRCIPDKNNFPPDRSTKGVDPMFLDQVTTCGPVTGYYPQTAICTDYADAAAIIPVLGGCRWDLGVGFCTKADIGPFSSGCASRVEDFVAGLISSHVSFLTLSTMINAIAMTYACCMFWKRKEMDVFPGLSAQRTIDIEFSRVKDEFEVNPDNKLLVKEGYVPATTSVEVQSQDNSA